MRLCIVGSSHVAMLMLAEREAPTPGLELTFFAAPAGWIGDVEASGSILRAGSEGLRGRLDMIGAPHEVDLDSFDGAVFVGETISAFSAVSLVRQHAVSGWPSAAPLIDKAGGPADTVLKRPLMSRAAYMAALVATARDNLTGRLVAGLRRASDRPVVLVPQPFPAERILKSKDNPVFQRVRRAGDGAALAESLDAARALAFADIPRLAQVPQPPETIIRQFFTRDDYARGAMRLSMDQAQPRDDVLHTGAAYGRLVMAQVTQAMQDLSGTR